MPAVAEKVAGETEIDDNVAAVIVMVDDPEEVPEVAVMVAEPTAITFASPALLTVAFPVSLDDQVTEFVRFWVEPSL